MNRISSALQFIPAQERDVWVAMAMAVKSELGDAGFDIWNDWSQTASNYNAMAARSVWKSCKGTGITAASLFHEAKQNGWRDEGFQKPTREQMEAQRNAAAERATKEGQDRIRSAQAAAKKADWILSQCKPEKHAYLDSKGFKELIGLVWRPEDEVNLLCIPMMVSGKLSSLQMIDKEGGKKFLKDGITAKAEYIMDAGGIGAMDWWTEGFASGLSLRECLHALKLRYRIHVCFSAGNLQRLAHSGYVVADNDATDTGRNAAIATGLPYWMPPKTGDDINDVHKANGTFRTSQMLRKWLSEMREAREWYSG